MGAVPELLDPAKASPRRPQKRSIDDQRRARTLARLRDARLAVAADREVLAGCCKSDMLEVKVLGEGAFGIVDLVLVEGPGCRGGLLCVRKKLLKQTASNHSDPQTEVEMMEACVGAAFVVQLWSHVVGLYDYTLLMEYCPYGSLDKLLQVVSAQRRQRSACLDWLGRHLFGSEDIQGFKEQEARFFFACSLVGLEAMHQRGIMHRDLKPSNLLINSQRYVRVADLGLAKRLGSDSKATSRVGTPGYWAPEVMQLGKAEGRPPGAPSPSYTYSADIWSLGMTLWEMVEGRLPRWAVVSWYFSDAPHFPSHFSQGLRSLLHGLLQKVPQNRLSIQAVRRHPWFAGFDWEALEQQSLAAPDFKEMQEVHIHTHLCRHAHHCPP
ncbi:kinase-like domain-containing protein [Haematococcus lacustris]